MNPMVFPFMMHPSGMIAQLGEATQRRDEPPARVKVAMEFLDHLTVKTMTRAAANDITIQEIPGQTLTEQEATTQESALVMLHDYFKGNLDVDEREQAFVSVAPKGPGSVINCPSCYPKSTGHSSCVLCRGTGAVVVYPTRQQQEDSK